MLFRVTVILEKQPEGGYTVTSNDLEGLVTEGDTEQEALSNAYYAFISLLEAYEHLNRPLPKNVIYDNPSRQYDDKPLSLTKEGSILTRCVQARKQGGIYHPDELSEFD